MWFIINLFLYFSKPKRILYTFTSFAIILCFFAYLLTIGRLAYRVETGFWIYASTLAIPLIQTIPWRIPHKLTITIIAIILSANLCSYASSGKDIRSPNLGSKRTLAIKDSTDYSAVFEYINSHPDKIFFPNMNAFMRFSHHKNPPYLAEPIGSYRNIVSFGYWTPYLPEVTKALKDFGIDNPIKDVVHDNVIVLDEPYLADFLQRHYYDSVAVDTLKEIGEMTFYKYRLVNKTNIQEDKQ